jgi:hypothetical protein
MLYADDTILLAESAEDLQVQLNAFGEYCDNWKMKVNVKLYDDSYVIRYLLIYYYKSADHPVI